MSNSYLEDEDYDVVNADGELSDEDIEPKIVTDNSDDDDDEVVDSPVHKSVARQEKDRLRRQARLKREQLESIRAQQNEAVSAGEEGRKQQRLNYLLKQAEVFQHFAGKKLEEPTPKKGRGRNAARYTEEMEDQEILDDEEGTGNAELARGHRLQVQPSIIVGGTMRDYQLQGLNWMIHLYDNGINGILADEMGLGKTLQTISLLAYLHEYRGITGPHLVIVPKSTLHNWINEFKRWCPTIRAIKFHGNQEDRLIQKQKNLQPGMFDVCVTSYEMVIKEKGHFRTFHYRYIIIDEAHRIKNENSILSRVVRMLNTNYRLLITGTPLQNNLHELWALLNFLLPEIFSSAEKFEEWFDMGDKDKEAEIVQQLHKVLRPFLLRRVKSDVERGLPPKKETILKISMSEMQRKYYAALLQKNLDALTGSSERSRLLNIVMQLRKCCNHPYLFQGAEPGPPFTTGEHLIENSGKLVLLDKLLKKLKERGSRVLIFSQMTRVIDILEDYCLYRDHKYCRIDGNTAGDDRERAIDGFNAPDSDIFMFLLSTRAGGLGINLATADIVVLYDSDWNPQMDLQAMDRAHRIGQKKEVQVFRFCIENSIEEKVIEKAYKKLRLDALIIQQGRLQDNTATKVNKSDLLSMVKYGAELVFSSEAKDITDQDIDAIITKGEKETEALNNKMQEFTEKAMQFTLDGGMMYEYKDEQEQNAGQLDIKTLVGHHWVDPPKRERKRVVNYSETAYYNQAMKGNKADKMLTARLPKMPALQDHQFFDTERLTELFNKEQEYEAYKHILAQREASLRSQGTTEENVIKELEVFREERLCDPLSEQELEERDKLLEQGFSNWSRRDFNSFVRACEKYGRHALDDISREIDGKGEDEVRQYAAVFWERYNTLNDSDRIIKTIEKGEAKIQRQQDIMNAVARKLNQYKNPWQDLKLNYGQNKGKAFTEEEDRFLVCMSHQLGYGAWEELKNEIRKCWRFRFDWFLKSRTSQELQRRCDTLIRLIEKECEEQNDEKIKRPRGRPPMLGEFQGTKKRRSSVTNLEAEEKKAQIADPTAA